MEKLSMCRICLVENVRMYVVVNKNLHQLYEKLTDVPFITVDSRPMLACFFCYTKLKQCLRLLRKCLEAEKLFAQMMKEDSQLDPLAISNHLEFFNDLINSPVVHVNIVGDGHKETAVIKEELPTVHEGVDDIIDPEWDLRTDELDPKTLYNSHPYVEAHHSSESEKEQLVMENKIKEEEEHELSENLTVEDADKLELENPDKSITFVEDIPAHDSESDSEDDVPLIKIKTDANEDQEVPKKKRRARVTRRAAVSKNLTLKRKLEDTIQAKQTKNELSDPKIIRTTKTSTSESVAKIKEPVTTTSQSSLGQFSNWIQHTPTRYICDLCQHSFRSKCTLKVHLIRRTCQKRIKCDVCQRSFTKAARLQDHSRIHAGKKSINNPFECFVCKRSYAEFSHLQEHIVIHTGIKPFKCDVCQRTYTLTKELTRHIRVHTGKNLVKCDVCQRNFTCSSKLKQHIRVHTGEKPYKCDVCQRSYSQASQLKQHVRIHTGEKPYKCDICQRSYTRLSYLKRHISVHM